MADTNIPSRLPTLVPGEVRRDIPQLNKAELKPKRRAPVNIWPSTEQIEELVSRALTALRHGVYWDRGSILNLVI